VLMKKILFLIHDLGQGGAEKVLVNLVNNMDDSKFDITVMALFDCGENKQFLTSSVKYKSWCKKMMPGNSHLMKLFPPMQLHRMIVREHYDIEVAYLEGPCARVISGCMSPETKKVSWIHIEQQDEKNAAESFRNVQEARESYAKFDKIVCVSETVKKSFFNALKINAVYQVLYNTNENKKIISAAKEAVDNIELHGKSIKIVGVGKLLKSKGFDRLLRISKRLVDECFNIHTYILGDGPERDNLSRYIYENKLEGQVTLLGYQLNPYKYVAKCNLFVCASHAEGFSTATTEALIVGIPVCTVEVSGMKEMLGENNEYGLVVENSDDALYEGIKRMLTEPGLLEHYKQQAEIRGKDFSTEETVAAVEQMLLQLYEE